MFRSPFLALLILSFAAPAFAVEADGTYNRIKVSTQDECRALCKDDWPTCRGVTAYQADVTKPIIECRLNNGMTDRSPFKPEPPRPLNISVALSDLNAYRAQHGLQPVILNTKLISASDAHSRDLATHNIAGHTGSDGSDSGVRVGRVGYQYSLVAENVAAGQQSWETVFKDWQESPGHNQNLLLSEATEFGIALVFDPKSAYTTYWTMLMGSPRSETYR